jgi:hypothetical protein
MKKVFTLLASVLLACSAYGQKTWTNVIVNGDLEGEAPAYAAPGDVKADAWNSFWVHEWPGDQSVRYDGTANVVEDPADPSNHCIKVVIRSRAEGEAAGNLTKDYTGNDGTYGSWDCQFFIYATQPIPQGKEIRLQLKVKADRDGSFETQNHSVPGTYIDATSFGNPKYTTEWTTLKLDAFTVTESQESSGFQSIAFNLCTDEDANVIYFDDIKLQIRDPQEDTGDAGAWINFMRKGIYSDDHITGVNSTGDPWECSNFTVQDLNQPEGEQQQKAPVVEVPGEPGVMAVKVPVKSYYIKEVEDLDEEGNQQFDEEGNVKMKSVYYWNDGVEIGTSAPARWQNQFFVSTLHKMVKGEKYRFKFRCKADRPANLGTQAHYGPGQYKDYNTFGSESDFAIDTDWKTFELGDFDSVEDASKHVIPSGANGCQTITFDCVSLQADEADCQPNNFYFIFEECSFTEKYVTIEDRTLGTPEELGLVVNLDEDEKANPVDMANMLNTFEVENFDFLKNPKAGDGIKLYYMIEPEDPEDDPIPSFSGILNWNDGGFINSEGYYIDDESGISIRLDEESVDGSNINVMVWNNPDSGISFENGETVSTKLAISQSGWYYIYNITLSKDGATGIKDIQTEKKVNAIYDLMGRKVTKMDKGIYIVNGKKYIVK